MASVSKWKHEDTGFVCLFVWKRDGRKAGGGLKVRRDTGKQAGNAEDNF